MPMIGCYTLDLYCQNIVELPAPEDMEGRNRVWRAEKAKHGTDWPDQYVGDTLGHCRLKARKRGWIFHRDGEVTCPRCAKAVKA